MMITTAFVATVSSASTVTSCYSEPYDDSISLNYEPVFDSVDAKLLEYAVTVRTPVEKGGFILESVSFNSSTISLAIPMAYDVQGNVAISELAIRSTAISRAYISAFYGETAEGCPIRSRAELQHEIPSES